MRDYAHPGLLIAQIIGTPTPTQDLNFGDISSTPVIMILRNQCGDGSCWVNISWDFCWRINI